MGGVISGMPECLDKCFRIACNAVPRWQLWRKGNAAIHLRFVLQYASYLHRSTPPICTGDTFEKTPGVGGFRKLPDLRPKKGEKGREKEHDQIGRAFLGLMLHSPDNPYTLKKRGMGSPP